MESGGIKGWRVQMLIKGEQKSKLFSDHVIGSKQEALEEAKAYRTVISYGKDVDNLNLAMIATKKSSTTRMQLEKTVRAWSGYIEP